MFGVSDDIFRTYVFSLFIYRVAENFCLGKNFPKVSANVLCKKSARFYIVLQVRETVHKFATQANTRWDVRGWDDYHFLDFKQSCIFPSIPL